MHDKVRKPSICLVSTSPILSKLLLGMELDIVGGAEVQQTLIVKMLMASGYAVSAVVHDIGQPDEVVTPDGLRLIKACRGKTSLPARLAPWNNPLWLAMKKADADVYYQRAPGSISGILCWMCKRLGKQFVLSTSTDMDLDGTKEKGLNAVKRALYRYAIKSASAVVVQTDAQNADLESRFGRSGVVIRNTFAPPDCTVNKEQHYIIWVASFRDVKRPEMFLELASRLPDFEFIMVGGQYVHQPEMFEEIKGKAQGIPNLRLTGHVPYEETGAYFDKAKLLVCTSTVEGFPNTFLQAWSRGTPVVSTVDPDTLIQRLGLGRYCPTIDDLTREVRMLISDEAARKAIGEIAVEYVNRNHHPSVVQTRYDELFEL
ncbi:MAG: glycosyltransferase family 4 protein [Armatimonadetes bacterium]|nr:glycosyltransferase family 4 protein [Armatimonadota bacterium]